MNAPATPPEAPEKPKPTGLQLLRGPIPDHLISPLPKPAKWQTDSDKATWIHCRVCGTKHHPTVVHLSYLGHAATTHILLDADLHWNWEPLMFGDDGLPRFDASGGLWIKLTVCGQTRLGYGNADKKNNADAGAREKEVIGDALRNAAMRFGLALELWSKADIHFADPDADDSAGAGGSERPGEGGQREEPTQKHPPDNKPGKPPYTDEMVNGWSEKLMSGKITAAKVISTVLTKYTLTDKQRADIQAMEVTPQ